MTPSELFFSSRPAFPWSLSPLGPTALAVVAVLLVLVTVWSYVGHPAASRRRISIILALRLLALGVALLTAVRPSVGVQDDPKLPSFLILGIDCSESMSVRDEFNDQTRLAAVKKVLERCEPVLEQLRTEQNVTVAMYAVGKPDFAEPVDKFEPALEAAFNRTDLGAYLSRTFDRWQTERFVRGHVLISDGIDNGTAFTATAEAARWRAAGIPLTTVAVGRQDTTNTTARDVAITAIALDPSPVPVKNDLTVKLTVNAFGFAGATPELKVSFDTGDGKFEEKLVTKVTLAKDRDNEIVVKLKAPDKPGEVRVRAEIPVEQTPGDVAPPNNVIETYLTVTKDGLRVLYVDRLTWERRFIRQALAADKRIDLFDPILQPESPPGPGVREDLDFAERAYDVVILGNVSAKQVLAVDPQFPAKLAEQVKKRGMGVVFTGGHATFLGTPNRPDAGGWVGVPEIEDLLPVDLRKPWPNAAVFDADLFGYLPEDKQVGAFLNKVADTDPESRAAWQRLNDPANRSRFTGLSPMGTAKPTATVFAVASADRVPPATGSETKYPPLLVGHQIGEGQRGRVLAFAAQDTYLWQNLGRKTREGTEHHARFWRQMVLWLAHQEESEGSAYARPEFRRLPVNGKQTIRVGLRAKGGAEVPNPTFDVKVIAPGETEATAQKRAVVPDPAGGFRVPYQPAVPGEYVVKLSASGTDAAGAEVKGDATARFLAFPDVSDEMVNTAANPDYLKQLAAAGGGKALRLDDLPAFLKELAATPLDVGKPKPRYLPDWRRDHSGGFLPAWLAVFAVLLAVEWGLRRTWGMV